MNTIQKWSVNISNEMNSIYCSKIKPIISETYTANVVILGGASLIAVAAHLDKKKESIAIPVIAGVAFVSGIILLPFYVNELVRIKMNLKRK